MKCAYSQTIEIEENKELEIIKKALESFGYIKEDLDYFQPKDLNCTNRKEQYKQVENALTRLEKLEKAIEIINHRDIELNLLKGTFKFDNVVGYNYYLKIWCITNSTVPAYIDNRYISQEEFNLLKEVFGNER